MGAWSYCFHVTPSSGIIDLSKIDKNILINLSHSGFFTSYLESSEERSIFTLQEIKYQCYKTARIFGYLNQQETSYWKNLLLSIAHQLPEENIIEFHFFCIDYNIPYYFQYDRQKKKTLLHIGSPDHVIYTKLNGILNEDDVLIKDEDFNEYEYNYNNDNDNDSTIQTEFDKEKYLKYYKFLEFNEIVSLV